MTAWLLLVAAGLPGGQDPDPSPVPVPPLLSSWFRLLRGDEHLGYVQEDLVQEPDGGRRRYHRLELRVASAPGFVERASQVDALVPEDASAARSLSWSAGERSGDWTGSGDSGIHALLPLLLLELRRRGELAEPGLLEARILRLEEGGFREAAQGIRVRETTRRAVFSGTATLTRLEFEPPCPAAPGGPDWVEAHVDRYGRIAEGRLLTGERLVLVKGEREAKGSLQRAVRGCGWPARGK